LELRSSERTAKARQASDRARIRWDLGVGYFPGSGYWNNNLEASGCEEFAFGFSREARVGFQQGRDMACILKSSL
jgi:hypothetical protein